MSHILGAVPITPCFVSKRFMYDMDPSKTGHVAGYMFGFRAVPGRVPSFQVMLETGAQWANVPIHLITTKPVDPLPVNVATLWDCFSDTFTVVELPLLKSISCVALGSDGVKRDGNYRFTIDWQGLWAEVPEQHKQHHIVELKSGHLVAYPNNKLLWKDPAYFKEGPLDYRHNTHFWSAEGHNKEAS